MKKVITIISCCIIIFSIGGCMNREKYMSDWFTSEQEEADKMMEQIIVVPLNEAFLSPISPY